MEDVPFYRLARLMEDKYGPDYKKWYWLIANFISFEVDTKLTPFDIQKWTTTTIHLQGDFVPEYAKVLIQFFGLAKMEDLFTNPEKMPDEYKAFLINNNGSK